MNEIIAEIGKTKYQIRIISRNEVLINDIKYQIFESGESRLSKIIG